MLRIVIAAALAAVAVAGVAQNETQTTGPSSRAMRTTSPLGNRGLTAEHFEKRWAQEEKVYKEAGISDEKIAKLKEINQKIWDARANGEKVDFRELNRQRTDVLTEEEMKSYREVLNSRIPEQLRNRDRHSTGTAQKDTSSTATAQ